MWQIPTQGRIGCGYVYSDRHVTPDQAKAEIEETLGHKIEPRNDISINAGRLAKVWRGNVLALGLSSSFLEPLEATSIHGTVVALLLFARRHLQRLGEPDAGRDRFNTAIAGQVDDFRDFINLHYVSERDDSPFWRDVASTYIQPETREKLALWQTKMPSSGDFKNDLDGLPHVEELLHYPVLDGLGLLNREVAKAAMAQKPAAPPWRKPSSINRHWPAKTLTESSRLYSPAMARLTPLTMVETGEPSFSNCSAQ